MKTPIKLVTFIKHNSFISFGDYILFQEYKLHGDTYTVSNPILVLYIGAFVADQTIGFEYIKWNKDYANKMNEIGTHIEWNDYIDVLGVWKRKPNWKEILKAYRNQNTKQVIGCNDFDVKYDN